jgi:hypothetical protein
VVVEQDFHKMGDEGHFPIEIGNLTILKIDPRAFQLLLYFAFLIPAKA